MHATSGARFIDYILSDMVAVPPEHASFFVESLLSMPPSLMPNRCHGSEDKREEGLGRVGPGEAGENSSLAWE